MPDRAGCRNGSPARGPCRRRRAITSSPLPARRSTTGPRPARTARCPTVAPTASCRELMALLKRAPNPFVTQLEQHVKLGAAKLWGVQLAAGFNRDKALAMYARAIKRLSAVIGDQDPSLLGSMMRSRGSRTFYQVRIGADTRPAADDLCNRIRRAGGACFVLRNMDVRADRAHRMTGLSGGSLDAGLVSSSVMPSTIPCDPVARAASRRSIRPNGKARCARSHGECARSPRRCSPLVLFATYLGIGALAHDTHFSLGWALASTAFVWAGPAQIILISTLGSGATVVQAAIAVTVSAIRLFPMVVSVMPMLRTPTDEAASSGAGGPFHRGHAVGRMLSLAAAGAARAAHRLHARAGQRPGLALPRCAPRSATVSPPICRNCSPRRSCC